MKKWRLQAPKGAMPSLALFGENARTF